jgi:transcriptional regulator with XRE-family HTH domain
MPGLERAMAHTISCRLRELRRDAEVTQREVAKRMGIHLRIVARVEQGLHYPTLDTVFRYASAIDLDAATVLVCFDDAWIEAGKRARFQMQCARPAKRVSARRVRAA